MDSFLSTFDSLGLTFVVLTEYWWIWFPLVMLIAFYEGFKEYTKEAYIATLKWTTYEIRIPIDAHKSLKAMEQVFAGFHVVGQSLPAKNLWEVYKKWRDKVFKGKVPDWLALEMVGMNGEIHFYARVIEKYKNLFESQVYAHYPDSELTEVPDYFSKFPPKYIPGTSNVNALELSLIKENIFPIKTYPEFEEEGAGKDDVRRIDPLAPMAETLAGLRPSEFFGIQLLIRSADDKWIKKDQPAVDKLMGKAEKAKTNVFDSFYASLDAGVASLADGEAPPKKEEKKEEDKPFNRLNPGIQEIIKAIERGTAKLSFESCLRLVYFAPNEIFTDQRMRSLAGAYKQFATQALNGFKPGLNTEITKGFRKPQRSLYNKKKLYSRFRKRTFPDKPFVLNTEELATIFHFPDVGVKTPALPRVDSKKGEAPAGIPTV
jgi:hypothetical protein